MAAMMVSLRPPHASLCFHFCSDITVELLLRQYCTGGVFRSSLGSKYLGAISAAVVESESYTTFTEQKERRKPIPVLERDRDGNFRISFPAKDSASPETSKSRPIALNLPKRIQPASKTSEKTHSKFSKAARRFYNEKFREPERLSKVLATSGVASRRACEEIIFAGRITVNGIVCKVPQTLVDPLRDFIYVDGHSLPKKLPPKLFFALNKPKGYICSNESNDSKSVLSLFDTFIRSWMKKNQGLAQPRLFTVGRLDVGTSGLLLVTNDGDFANKVSHPSSGVLKEYIATICGGSVTRRKLNSIAQGSHVQGVLCVPKEVEVLEGESDIKRTRLRIVVSEGRNHEVRMLVENAGLEVQALKRVRIGSFRLPRNLSGGKHQQLTEQQANKILDARP